MKTFKVGESVVVDFYDGSSASGKVIRQLDDGRYLVLYLWRGWTCTEVDAEQLTSFDGSKFMVTAPYDPATRQRITLQDTQLQEAAD